MVTGWTTKVKGIDTKDVSCSSKFRHCENVNWHVQICSWPWLSFLTWQELQKSISCLAGFAKFYKQEFSEAKELFM